MFPLVATLTYQSTEHKKTAPMERVPTRYSEIVADVTRDTGQHALSEEDLLSLKERIGSLRGY